MVIQYLVPLLGATLTGITLLSQTELWQRKEYRLDRFRSWALSREGLPYLISWAIGSGVIITAAWLSYIYFYIVPLADTLGLVLLLTFLAYRMILIKQKGVFRPHLTNKALLIITTTTVLVIGYLLLSFAAQELIILQWTSLVWITPLLVSLAVAIVNIPAGYRKHQIIARATTYRRRFPKITTIAVTGSYGKTSTKHFALQIIPGATGTQDHHNTPIGIAQDILEQLSATTPVYITEAGAYRRGEISEITSIVQPTISVITAIGNQHLDLFGSRDNILKTKWEIIDALPPNGIAVLNSDDKLLQKKAKTVSNQIIWYSQKTPADIYAQDISIEPTAIRCTLHIKDQSQTVTIPLAGEGSLASALAAAAIALAVKVPANTIYDRIQKLTPFPHTMEIKPGPNHSTIIDDGYSANETGVLAAINHLKKFPQADKRIVLKPLIELGQEASSVHEKIGAAIASANATCYLTSRTHAADISKGLSQAGSPTQPIVIANPKKLAETLQQNLNQNTVILLEGRMPAIITKTIIP